MNDKFKGANHCIQMYPLPPRPTPGNKVTWKGEEIGVVESVVDDSVFVKVKAGKLDEFLKAINAPEVHVSAFNYYCRPSADIPTTQQEEP